VVGILALPQLAAIGALCALVSQCSIEVVRTEKPDGTIPHVDDERNPDENPPAL
jgi:hypothetical protein